MIRIIAEIKGSDDDYLEISREMEDILREAPWKIRFQSELVTDSHREAGQE